MQYNRTFARIIVSFFRAKTFKALIPGLLVACSYTAFLVWIESELITKELRIAPFIYQLVGIVLGLLLVFRTNTAYDKWWEGRKLLGALVNNSRNLALKLNAYLPENQHDARKYLNELIINFAFALKEHLRHGVDYEQLIETNPPIFDKLHATRHVPNKIASLIFETVHKLNENGILKDEHLITLNPQLDSLTDITGACERIKKTPIPQAYRVHLLKFIFLFISLLPLGLVSDMKYWSLIVVAMIFYAFVGLDFIANEIEDPFGDDANDLPTDAICNGIKDTVSEIFGQPLTKKD
jgi:putative membrane protein